MSHSNVNTVNSSFSFARWSVVLALFALMLALSGCLSTTKVYTADKTITYNGTLYNMSNVQKISSSVSGTLANGDVVNLKTMDKKAIEQLIKQQSSPMLVTTTLHMDSQDLVYQNSRVKKYSDYSSMLKKFESAQKSIGKFMANKKSTQLKLK